MKDTPTQVFSSKYCKIFENTFFEKDLRMISYKKTNRWYYGYYEWTDRYYEWTDGYYEWTNEWTDEYYEWKNEYYEWINEYYEWVNEYYEYYEWSSEYYEDQISFGSTVNIKAVSAIITTLTNVLFNVRV